MPALGVVAGYSGRPGFDGALGRGDSVRPASRIYWEIFTKRGMTRAFGCYNISGLVREPAGWLPLADKMMLI